MNVLTGIGRAFVLTRGTKDIVVQTGQLPVPKHSPARYCFYMGQCRMIIDNGMLGVSATTQLTSDPACTASVSCTLE